MGWESRCEWVDYQDDSAFFLWSHHRIDLRRVMDEVMSWSFQATGFGFDSTKHIISQDWHSVFPAHSVLLLLCKPWKIHYTAPKNLSHWSHDNHPQNFVSGKEFISDLWFLDLAYLPGWWYLLLMFIIIFYIAFYVFSGALLKTWNDLLSV